MTVKELIAKLQELPQDMPVLRDDSSYDDGCSIDGAGVVTIKKYDYTTDPPTVVEHFDVVMLS